MDILLLIIGFLVGFLLKDYLPTYAKEKGKNLATKEDISDITELVEEVRSQHSSELERLKVDLGLLARKHDILLDEKIRVFKELQKKLISFKRYCEAAWGELEGGEFHPRLEGLPEECAQSVLSHLTNLHYLEQANYIFLSDGARKALESLHSKMSIMCSMELAMHDTDEDPVIMNSAAEAYKSGMASVDKCLVKLYKDL